MVANWKTMTILWAAFGSILVAIVKGIVVACGKGELEVDVRSSLVALGSSHILHWA